MGSELVKADHLNRKAVVYIRQSTPHQVVSTNSRARWRPHNTKDDIRLGEMNRFWKAALGGGRQSTAHRYRRIERSACFQHSEAQHQKLAHRSHDNLLGLRRPRDFNRVTSATIAELYRMADSAGMYSAALRTALPILEMCVARSMDFPD
jgi:hypothetical protein